MSIQRSLIEAFAGSDAEVRRQVSYWAITLGLYTVCVLLLAAEVAAGAASARPASWLAWTIAVGALLFYVPVRASLLTNRRHMNELLAYEKQRHDRKGHTLCLAMLDIDFFKRVNDSHGHAAGDEVLRALALRALSAVRATDVLARWGGEEFLLMLPDTELQAASQVLAPVQGRVAAQPMVAGGASLQITFSAGLTASRPGEAISAAIDHADRAMYLAKAGGLNRVVAA